MQIKHRTHETAKTEGITDTKIQHQLKNQFDLATFTSENKAIGENKQHQQLKREKKHGKNIILKF